MRVPSVLLLAILSLSVFAHPILEFSGRQAFGEEYPLQRSIVDELYDDQALVVREGALKKLASKISSSFGSNNQNYKKLALHNENPNDATNRLRNAAINSRLDFLDAERERLGYQRRHENRAHPSSSHAEQAGSTPRKRKQLAAEAKDKAYDTHHQESVWNLGRARDAHAKTTIDKATAKKQLAILTRAHRKEKDPLYKSKLSNSIKEQEKVVSEAKRAKQVTGAQVAEWEKYATEKPLNDFAIGKWF
ncbi:hypothetical protein DACRYDRAFT_102584 [Dacryopinax primogenitus]|uniref:Uncharacterized protein n=1 Tax=Dacryopinax primogenitus (strain DJM 731) TaxID=1858805 RepID=M5FPP2_DACPD|nr:uncharacterized protein DACRYDRAFT_102584 [Dacryopinax primogenitus]EJT97208.1 hypothetical protein DACRYDRAFT_102584 [Dacryopinax primogenitus]